MPQPIIEHFDVLKDVLCRLVPCAVLTMIDMLAVQCAKETLDTGIVPTVPPSRHAAGHDARGEQLLVCGGERLAPPDPTYAAAPPWERDGGQPSSAPAARDHRSPSPQRPSDHRARIEVEDHRQDRARPPWFRHN